MKLQPIPLAPDLLHPTLQALSLRSGLFLKVKEKALHCFKKSCSCKSILFNWKKVVLLSVKCFNSKIKFFTSYRNSMWHPRQSSGPKYWPLKSAKVKSKTYWLSMWPASASQQLRRIPFLILYPKMLNPHHHCPIPQEKGWAAYADKRRKRSHPSVILQKENHRTSTEACRNPALIQARMTPPYMGTCTRKYTHISVTSAHSQSQGEGNMTRGTLVRVSCIKLAWQHATK